MASKEANDGATEYNQLHEEKKHSDIIHIHHQKRPNTKQTTHNNIKTDLPLDFSEAQAKMKEDENKRRVEEGLSVGLTKEVRRSSLLL